MNRHNNEYARKARAFLEKTGTMLNVQFLTRKKHFLDDKEERDVYLFSIVRGDKTYTGEFGDSIINTQENRNRAVRQNPGAYDILSCLTKYEPADNVDDFANEYGYTKPSEALRVFEGVRKEWAGVCEIWNEQEREELAEIS